MKHICEKEINGCLKVGMPCRFEKVLLDPQWACICLALSCSLKQTNRNSKYGRFFKAYTEHIFYPTDVNTFKNL